MARGWRPWIGLLGLSACAYITKPELDGAFDADGDGWGVEQDCAPTTKTIFPGAPDLRGDGCDADCGIEPDLDGDDWPDDSDCAPTDASRFPCAPGDKDGDNVDVDCDGLDTPRAGSCDPEPGWVTDGTAATRFGDTCPNPVALPT
jgi:hypothetical protein